MATATVIAVELLPFLGIKAILLGSVLGHPVLLGFVETGSMQATLDPGDVFVTVPTAVAGAIKEGDVMAPA